MDKAERKNMLQAVKAQEKTRFEASLPMARDLFERLFDYLDEQLTDEDCSNTLALTVSFLEQNNIESEPVSCWLKEHGGYCDCEVLANIEELF